MAEKRTRPKSNKNGCSRSQLFDKIHYTRIASVLQALVENVQKISDGFSQKPPCVPIRITGRLFLCYNCFKKNQSFRSKNLVSPTTSRTSQVSS